MKTKVVSIAFVCALAGGLLFQSASPAAAARYRSVRSYHRLVVSSPQRMQLHTLLTQAIGDRNTSNLALLGGIPFQRIHTAWAGYSPQQRADKVQERVNLSLSQGPIHPSDITTGHVQGDMCVLLKGRRFLTADAAAAAYDHSTPHALAAQWAHRMRVLLPALTKPKG